MSPKRIIIVMIEPPLPFGNAAARWFYVLFKGLVQRGHRVTSFAACSNRNDMERAAELFPPPAYDLRCFPHPQRAGIRAKLQTFLRPFSYMFGDDLKHELAIELARGCDVLHLEQLWSGWMGQKCPEKSLVNIHHLTMIDLEQAPAATLKQRLAYRLMWKGERQLLRSLRNVRTCSPRLEPFVRRYNPSADVTTVPVGLDMSLYPFIPDEHRCEAPVVSVIGSMDWYPTRSAAVRLLTRLWPKIKVRIPGARVQIVGWNARSALKEHLGLTDVTIEENVPDIRPYFERTSVLLYAPGRGSGMKIKILEAMGFGVPVVTTSEGIEGIPAIDGVHAGVCEDDDGLIDRTVSVLGSREEQNRLRAAARALLEVHCGPVPTLDAIEAIHDRIANRRGRP